LFFFVFFVSFVVQPLFIPAWELPMSWTRRCLPFVLALCLPTPAAAQKNLGFDNTKPSGQPYLAPEESLRRLRVPPGFEVKLFAAEPDIINPIAFTVDEQGRLWVVECYEYPKRTAKGAKPRDRIKVLEDTTGAGRADKVTVWAEGKNLPIGWDLASGIEVGHGGVFLGAAPHLFFLRDTQGAGRCDKQEILLSGFGSQDTHETLNTLQWGPDSLLYGLHGIFTQSRIGEVKMNAAVWRYDSRRKQFGIFAEGTSNPWGLDFDAHGQAFLTACVIPHAFHMVPGGTYIRQAGAGINPYAYGQLKEISDHLHHAESGWAHAGALVLEGEHVPPEYRGSLLMGSIHGCAIKRDVLERRGSTFVARHAPDFLVSGDKNFRPINLRWGPDGSIYVIDWHDQNPCHQAHPDSWDMTHGRIYKIRRTGTKSTPPGDLAKKSSKELVELLQNDNPWCYRTALRLLGERQDKSVAPQLRDLLFKSENDAHSLRGLWGLHAVGAFEEIAGQGLDHKSPWVRAWTVRLMAIPDTAHSLILARLAMMALQETAPEVRLELASKAQTYPRANPSTRMLLENLMRHPGDAADPCIPLMIWLAYEPLVVAQRSDVLDTLTELAPGNLLVRDAIVPRAMRRLVATGKPDDLAACVAFLDRVKDSAVRRRALEGLVQALQNQQVNPPGEWKRVFAALTADGDGEVPRLARRLAVHFRDVEAIKRALATARDLKQMTDRRLEAIRDLGLAHPPEARARLLALFSNDPFTEVRCEACRALAAYAGPETARDVLATWGKQPPRVRAEAVNLLAERREWARELLAAIGNNQVPRTDVTNSTILRIRAFRDPALNAQIEKVWGRVRDTPAELNALIDKMRSALHEGRASAARGRVVYENQCAKCHKFEGKGHDVGPNLDGAARDIEYLLVNVLDPNRVVGQPYFPRFVALKDGRVETGLLAAEDERSITLKGENDALKVLQKKDIDEITVQDKSLMPEGLANNMTVQDFRDLVRYLMASPYLTEVAVAGPFAAKDGPAVDPANPLQSAAGKWSWPPVGSPGRIPLPAGGKADAVAYLAAEVTAPAAMRTRLQLGAGHTVRAWVNGKEVYQGKPGDAAAPDQAGVDVDLRAGVNRLLFQVTYPGDRAVLYARLLDPQRKLTYAESK
jgi:putative membrane-bound dehydrogenase-like protein